jgi:glycerophosphoryl diester phosphodiesterase
MSETLNIAHRGFTKDSPDNTLESFYAAIKLGADGIECDVHETADHHFVIFHDDELAGKSLNTLSLSEIRKVKLAAQYQVPTLEETLNLCHKRIKLMLELKQVDSLDLFLEIVNAVMKPEELFITSFNNKLVKELADFAPHVQRGILIDGGITDPLKVMDTSKARIILPRFAYTTAALVNALHNHRYSIMVWDCNSIQNLRTALDWGIDGVITDSPANLALEMTYRKRLRK